MYSYVILTFFGYLLVSFWDHTRYFELKPSDFCSGHGVSVVHEANIMVSRYQMSKRKVWIALKLRSLFLLLCVNTLWLDVYNDPTYLFFYIMQTRFANKHITEFDQRPQNEWHHRKRDCRFDLLSPLSSVSHLWIQPLGYMCILIKR